MLCASHVFRWRLFVNAMRLPWSTLICVRPVGENSADWALFFARVSQFRINSDNEPRVRPSLLIPTSRRTSLNVNDQVFIGRKLVFPDAVLRAGSKVLVTEVVDDGSACKVMCGAAGPYCISRFDLDIRPPEDTGVDE